jgi:hypothetical protein
MGTNSAALTSNKATVTMLKAGARRKTSTHCASKVAIATTPCKRE